MMRAWTIWSVVGVIVLVAPLTIHAQETRPAAAQSGESSDVEHGRRLLASVRDHVFSFDDPGFYWFCEYVQSHPNDPDLRIRPEEGPTPWKMLMERPSDYRGRLVLVEGVLQARYAYDVADRGNLGQLFQCELSAGGTRALCAIVSLEDPAGLPIRSRVRAKGYFIKVRGYRTTKGEEGAGPLLVARRIEPLPRLAGAETGADERSGVRLDWMIAAIATLGILWLVLRRRARSGPGVVVPKRDSTRNPVSAGADGDYDWLAQDIPPQENPPP